MGQQASRSWTMVWLGLALGTAVGGAFAWSRPQRYEATADLPAAAEPAFDQARLSEVIQSADLYPDLRQHATVARVIDTFRRDLSVSRNGATVRVALRGEDAGRVRSGLAALVAPVQPGPAHPVREVPWLIWLSCIGTGGGIGGIYSIRHYWRQFMGF